MTTIWCVMDDRPGHRNQVKGLVRAIAKRCNVSVHDLPSIPAIRAWPQWVRGRFPAGANIPAPDLIIGAGHGTHPCVLAAKRAYGGRTVVLMRPTLPTSWFDLCIVPRHDGLAESPRVITTHGAINLIEQGAPVGARPAEGMVLLGGPSAHHRWPEEDVLSALHRLTKARPDLAWTVTTSRRTPATTLTRLAGDPPENAKVLPGNSTPADFLPTRLPRSREVWVTEESVSMIYEALTSGAAVGLIELPRSASGRVARGIDELITTGLVTPFSRHPIEDPLPPPAARIAEADRCAEMLIERGFLSGVE